MPVTRSWLPIGWQAFWLLLELAASGDGYSVFSGAMKKKLQLKFLSSLFFPPLPPVAVHISLSIHLTVYNHRKTKIHPPTIFSSNTFMDVLYVEITGCFVIFLPTAVVDKSPCAGYASSPMRISRLAEKEEKTILIYLSQGSIRVAYPSLLCFDVVSPRCRERQPSNR